MRSVCHRHDNAATPGKRTAMKIITIAVAGLLAGTLLTASPAHAEVTAHPLPVRVYPLQPNLGSDLRSEVRDLLQQISDLDDSWDNITPEARQQRLAQLQQQVTIVDKETRGLPAEQQPQVQAMLGMAVIKLANILRRAQPPDSPCYLPSCLPGL